MSARRRRTRKRRTPLEQLARARKRRGLVCRAYHWRELRASFRFEPWRRPYDWDGKVAYFVARCPVDRTQAVTFAAVAAEDECAAPDPVALEDERLALAKRVLLELVTPRRRR